MKKVSFSKSCFNKRIDYDGEIFYSSYTYFENKFPDYFEAKKLFRELLDKIEAEDDLYDLYISIHYSLDDIIISKEEMKGNISNYINKLDLSIDNISWFCFFENLEMMMEFLSTEDIDYDDCEQCGDYNYEIEVFL